MWLQYRKWKKVLGFPLVMLVLFLMRGEPGASQQWYVGMGIALMLGISYVIVEVVWIAQRRGRPCQECGQKIQMKPFSLSILCPQCGKALE